MSPSARPPCQIGSLQAGRSRVGGLQLARVHADAAVVGGGSERRVAFGARSGVGAFGGMHLGVGCFQISALLISLRQCGVHGQRCGGGKGNFVGDLVLLVGRQADHARQIYFLLGKIVLERKQTLLMRQCLHLVAIGVDFGDEALGKLLLALVVDRVRALQLRFLGSHARLGRDRLQIRPADGQRDQLARVLRGIPIGFGNLAGGAVIVDCR